jgi:methyltransferase
MHPSNPYASKKPDFKQLATKYPSFAPLYVWPVALLEKITYLSVNTSSEGFSNIDWKDVGAVRALNYALLKEDWQLDVEMMENRLCPPL